MSVPLAAHPDITMPSVDLPAADRTPQGPDDTQAPARDSKQRAFIVSVAVALVLNGSLLAGLAFSVQKWRAAPHPSRQVSWVTTVAPVPPPIERHPADKPVPSRPPVATPYVPESPITPRVPSEAPAPPPESAPTTKDAGNSVRFYAYREVDQPAEPDSDWNLDAALLDAAGVTRLVFDVFVNADGEVVACTILQPTDLSNETRQLLEERLRRTNLRPAVRTGIPVPSVRRIELSVQ